MQAVGDTFSDIALMNEPQTADKPYGTEKMFCLEA